MAEGWPSCGGTQTPNLLPVPTDVYTPVSLVAAVPAGADTAHVVYAIQSFTNETLPDLGTVYVDDASLTVVPEPATVGLLGVAWRRAWALGEGGGRSLAQKRCQYNNGVRTI